MSTPDDPKGKPKPTPPPAEVRRPTGPVGAGRSASARSIGEELGGLDFEPDALLDSLLSDEPPKTQPPKEEPPKVEAPKAAEPAPRAEPVAEAAPGVVPPLESLGPKLLTPEVRLYPEEETTIAHAVKRARTASSEVDALLEGETEAPEPAAPKAAPAPAAPPLRPPRIPPRPGAPPRPAGPPRPAVPQRPVAPPRVEPPAPPPEPAAPELAAEAEPPHQELAHEEFHELEPATSDADAEIDALVGSLDLEAPPPELPAEPPASEPLPRPALGDSEDATVIAHAQIAEPRLAEPPPVVADDDELWAAPSLEGERPAASHLAEQELLEQFTARAAWMQSEAEHAATPHAKARALLVASELWAMSGDPTRARELAASALAVTPTLALAQRQVRLLAAAEGDHKLVVAALDGEARTSANPDVRSHALYLCAEIQRVVLKDAAQADKRFDALQKVSPNDPRPYLARLARDLGTSDKPPKLALPEEAKELAAIGEATAALARLRGDPSAPAPDNLDAIPFEEARRCLEAGDRQGAGNAISRLTDIEGFENAALWLASALLTTTREARSKAIELLTRLLAETSSSAARRALAARALEQGDPQAVTAALGSTHEAEASGFLPQDLVALAALTGGDRQAVQPWLEGLEGDPRLAPLAAAAASATATPDAAVPSAAGGEGNRTAQALGRAMIAARAEGGDPSLLRSAVEAFSLAHPGHPLTSLLALELALRAGAGTRVATVLGEIASSDDGGADPRSRHLAAALAFEIAKDRDAAAREYAAVLRADPTTEAAARALIAGLEPAGAADLLVGLAEATSDDTHRSLLLTEAALRLGLDADETPALLDKAASLAPTLPFAYRLAKQRARSLADADELLSWLRRRRDAADDPIEKALDAIREALLVADADGELAASLLGAATAARPSDIAVHELHERLAPAMGASRGAWREQVAQSLEGAAKTRLLVEAALEYERADDREAAARAAFSAAEASDSAFARITAERLAGSGPGGAELAEKLLAEARAATDPDVQRELYERLGALDRARGDTSSALLWQNAVIETSPKNLKALRTVEHTLMGSGRADELEPTFAALASLVDRNEAVAHALLAAQLRAKADNPAGVREMAELAAKLDPPALWALRSLSALASETHDDELTLRIDKDLSERASRAIDAATLALRAAEAAYRLGKLDEARTLLERTVELVPDHLIALALQADVLEQSGNFAGAAGALETLAATSGVDEHKIESWHRAALLWLDKAGDPARGLVALEQAAELDLRYKDVFERLRGLYVAGDQREKLAELLERRLELTDDPEERVALEVTRGRALAEIGDKSAARAALASALDANPDHADALDAFAEISVAEGDWEGAEQSWIRLARHASEPERQAEIYRKLGRLYDTELPNPQRAELSYREVLKRLPNDTGAMERLVFVYGRMGDTQKALEMQTDLLNRAGTPEEKRDRTISLAAVQEEILKDRRKAESTLDKARKTWPQDGAVLKALAEFYRRGNETTALNVLLDRAANDSRRALSTGRFDASLFEALATVAELRGGHDAAAVANATLAALHGDDSKLPSAGLAAGDARLDDLLAPELLSLPLRALLRKAGDALDQAYAVDLRAMRAAPLAQEAGAFGAQIREMATAFGIHNVEVYVSPALGPACMPVTSAPPRLVLGSVLLEKTADEAARSFLILRALKILQAHAPTLSRTAPIDLWPLLAAFLGIFATNWQPPGVDAKKLAEAQQRIKGALVRRMDDDVPVLALEVIGSIGNRASQLGTAVNQWGNRTALLAIGSPNVALRGVALAGGHLEGPPSDNVERLKWIVRNPEARDLAVFSVSEQYSEARKRLGLGV